jgi:hypothetical protein
MSFSSSFCRTQEAHQRSRAADTPLQNVRNVAETAAIAWGHEAVAAERREARQDRAQIAQIGALMENIGERDRMFSENPDRGNSDMMPRS